MYTKTIIERMLVGNYASREKKLLLNVIIVFKHVHTLYPGLLQGA